MGIGNKRRGRPREPPRPIRVPPHWISLGPVKYPVQVASSAKWRAEKKKRKRGRGR